ARRDRAAHVGIALPEAARIVAETAVPFGEAGRMVADLVAAGTDVPRFRDQLDLRQHRVLAQRVEEAAARIEAAGFAAERDAEVEAEAVDVEFLHPVAQRI